jgi:hypothetical protein
VVRVVEGIGDRRIDIYQHIAFGRDQHVSLPHHGLQELGEGVSAGSIDNVDNESLRKVADVLWIWE